MKSVKLYPKIARDSFLEQFKWSIWFFSFLTFAHVIGMFIANRNDANVEGFFVFSSYSAAIFMLVCGIIAAFGFMAYFVQHGISRKDMFFGLIIGAFGLAIAVTVVPLAIHAIEHLISNFISMPVKSDSLTIFERTSGWFSAIGVFFLNVFTYYLVGWLIGIGYYRFNWLIGLGFVGLAIVALSLNGFFWGEAGLSTIIPWIPYIPTEASLLMSVIGSLLLIAVLIIATRMLTKRIPIKL